MQVLIPISENTIFFPKEEYFFPKPIVEVINKPLIVQVIKHLEKSLNPDRFIFVIPKDLEISWSIKNIISLSIQSKSEFFIRPNNTTGSLSSCLLASGLIQEGEVLVVNMDEIIDSDLSSIIESFRERNSTAGLIAYQASHPRWSYGIIDDSNNVSYCAEKKVIGKYAFAGFYYFNSKDVFIESCSKVLLEDDSVDGKYFLSSAINQIILMKKLVSAYKIPSSKHHSLFSPEMIKEFERSDFAKKLKSEQKIEEFINIIIPAAGKGLRFINEGWKAPKPYIDINGSPMMQHVIDNLATENSNIYLILQQNHIQSNYPELSSNKANSVNRITIDYITSGTACTVLHAKSIIDQNTPLLIANSDQIVDFKCELFIQDALERNLDGSILVFKDKYKDPKWSFAKLNENGFVEEVAEKNPISNIATVGIYFFTKGSDFVDAALDMIKHDDRVNNEFYTCPVYNYLIRKGKKIGVYEVDFNSMHGIGTPEDLIKYQDLKNYSNSKHQPK